MYDCMRTKGGNYKGAANAFWLGFWSLQLVIIRSTSSAVSCSRVSFKQCPEGFFQCKTQYKRIP